MLENTEGAIKSGQSRETGTIRYTCTRSSTGSLTSKNYPGPYDANTDCLYIVKPPSGSLCSLKVDVFQMADNGDFLEVFIL
jgi:hypothetical protein